MSVEMTLQNQSQQIYVRALSTAWRHRTQIWDPSVWLNRDPDAEAKMLRDADIAQAVGFRQRLVAGRQWTIVPKTKGSPRGDMAVAVANELLGHIEQFTDARLNLASAFFYGSRFAKIHLQAKRMRIGDGRLRTWLVPVRLEDEDKKVHRVVPKTEDGTLSAHWEHWNIPQAKWVPTPPRDALRTIRHVYQDDQSTLGHGRALREALGWWWYAKEHVFHESLQAVERFAQGIVHAKIDGLRDAATGMPNPELIRAWQEVLEDLRARHVLVSDRNDSIEIIQGNAQGWELLKTIRDELRNSIVTLVLCANLTTSADKGGSYALGEIQENSTEALVQHDREVLEETLSKQLLGCVWHENYANLVELGVVSEKPRFSIRQEKKLDPKVRADVANVLHGMGVPIAKDDIYEQTGFRKPQEGEDVVEGAAPMPTGFGDGMLPQGDGAPVRGVA